MDTINIKGIVIRSVDYGETSKILTVFSFEKGIISIMAKGVKNPKSKKQNLISLFTESNFELTKSKDFYYLRDGEILKNNFHIRDSVKKIYLCQLFFDIIERTTLKNEKNNQIYNLLIKTLDYLKFENDYLTIANMFLIKLISMHGYKPILTSCAKCNKKSFERVFFSNEMGGILCEECRNINSIELSYKEYKYLCNILVEVYENTDIIDKDTDKIKIFKLLINFIVYNTDIIIPNSYKIFVRLEGIE